MRGGDEERGGEEMAREDWRETMRTGRTGNETMKKRLMYLRAKNACSRLYRKNHDVRNLYKWCPAKHVNLHQMHIWKEDMEEHSEVKGTTT